MSYEYAETRPHRIISAQDSDPDTGADGKAEITAGRAIDFRNKPKVNLYVVLTGTTPALVLVPYWWDESSQAWFKDADQSLSMNAGGSAVTGIEARGRYCQMRATTLTGDDVQAVVRYQLPIQYGL